MNIYASLLWYFKLAFSLWNYMFVPSNNRRSGGRELIVSWPDMSADLLQGVFNMVRAEDSPGHQYPTLPFASAFGDVFYQLSLLQSVLFGEIFVAFFGQMCPLAMFQTKSHVAVSTAECSGEVVMNNHVERVRSRAVITSYPNLVQGNHIQIAKTLGRDKCVHLPTEYPLDGFKWSPEAVTAIF